MNKSSFWKHFLDALAGRWTKESNPWRVATLARNQQVGRIENNHQLEVTMRKLLSLMEAEDELEIGLASIRGLINDLDAQILDYQRRLGVLDDQVRGEDD